MMQSIPESSFNTQIQTSPNISATAFDSIKPIINTKLSFLKKDGFKIMTLKNKKDCSNSMSLDVDTLTLNDAFEDSLIS